MKPIKVLIADDHTLIRTGIIEMLVERGGYEIVGEAQNGIELIDKYFKLNPDILLVDINMPGLSGLKAIKKIKEKDDAVKSLFLSIYDEEQDIYQVYKAGGMGLAGKWIDGAELDNRIKAILKNKFAFGDSWNSEKLKELEKKYAESVYSEFDNIPQLLTFREMEIFLTLGSGLENQQIKEKLFIDIKTIQAHRANIMKKLKIVSSYELLRISAEFVNRSIKIK